MSNQGVIHLTNPRYQEQSDELGTLMIGVLDHGYVRLADWMGSDLSPVNAARASFGVKKEDLDDQDRKLIRYLADHGHTSPFRHAMMSLEVKAPLFVARQWWKHVVGSDHTMDAWNELSFRYVTSAVKGQDPEFYEPGPDAWRGAPANKKQGSSVPIPREAGDVITRIHRDIIRHGVESYKMALQLGVAVEQARLLLPAYGMYTTWYWSASLQAICHFLTQRLDEHAQWEIQEYARAVAQFALTLFPSSVDALTPKNLEL